MPLQSEVHVDQAMTEFSLRYANPLIAYRADHVFPVLPVKKESDKWFKYDKSNLRAENDGPRGMKEPAREATYTVSTDSYSMGVYNLADLVPDRLRDNADQPLDPDQDCVANLTDKLLVSKEVRAAAKAFSTTNVTQYTTLTGTDQWSDYINSDPLDDIETGIQTVVAATGAFPNAIHMGAAVWSKLKFHPALIERVKYVSATGLSIPQVASIIEIPPENFTIGAAVKNTANEGQTSDSLSFVWGKGVLTYVRNPNPSPRSGGFGACIRMRSDREVSTWRSNNPKGDWYMVEMSYVLEITDDTFGYYIDAAVA